MLSSFTSSFICVGGPQSPQRNVLSGLCRLHLPCSCLNLELEPHSSTPDEMGHVIVTTLSLGDELLTARQQLFSLCRQQR